MKTEKGPRNSYGTADVFGLNMRLSDLDLWTQTKSQIKRQASLFNF
jgi:hypothetical protein